MVAEDRNENKIQIQDTLWLPRTVVQKKKKKENVTVSQY